MDRRTFLKTLLATFSLVIVKFPKAIEKIENLDSVGKVRRGAAHWFYGKSPHCSGYYASIEEGPLDFTSS